MQKCFLDTNILTDWAFINSEIKKKKNIKDKLKYLEAIKNIREVALYSYLLLETLSSNRNVPNFKFFTSRVALAELISNIKERYIAEDLFRKLIPIKYLQKIRKEYVIKKIANKADVDTRKFIRLFVKSGKVTLREVFNQDAILTLILKERIDTYDALLISQSIAENCDYFITSDSGLKIKINSLKIVKPNEIYNKIKNTVEKPTLKF